MKQLTRIAMGLLALLLFGISAVYAVDSTVPLANYIGKTGSEGPNRLLYALFGNPGNTDLFGAGTGNTSNFGSMLNVFNLAVFAIAQLFFVWNMISATLSGMQDGEWLGKRYNSTWMPIRTVLGVAMLVPAFSGWNFAQLLMAWATAAGIGIAGIVAASAGTSIDATLKSIGGTSGSTINPDVPRTISKASDFNVSFYTKTKCIAGMIKKNQLMTDATVGLDENGTEISANQDSSASDLTWDVFQDITTVDGHLLVRFGVNLDGAETSKDGYNKDSCGVIDFIIPKGDDVPSIDDYATDTNASVAANLQNRAKDIINASGTAFTDCFGDFKDANINPADAAATEKSVLELMQKLNASNNPTDNSETENKIKLAQKRNEEAFDLCMTTKVSEAITELTAITLPSTDWIAFGYRNIPSMAVNSLVGSNSKPGMTEQSGASKTPNILTFDEAVTGSIAVADGPSSVEKLKKFFSGVTVDPIEWLNNQVRKVFKSFLNDIGSLGDGNPITKLQLLGMGIVNWIAVLVVAYIVLGITISAVSLGVLTGPVILVGMILMGFVLPLLFFGIKLMSYVPFIPAIIWTMAIMNWLVIVTESFFGASLWALIHMDPEGEGLGQGTKHGYIFLLNLLFRPAIMVIALSLSFIMMGLITKLFTTYVVQSVTAFIGNSYNWIHMMIMLIGAFWVVTSFMESVISKSMELIFIIPNQVFTWIGGSMASNVGMGAENQIGSSVQQGMGGLQSAVSQGVSTGGQAAMTANKEMLRERQGDKDKAAGAAAKAAETEKSDAKHAELVKAFSGGAGGGGAGGGGMVRKP